VSVRFAAVAFATVVAWLVACADKRPPIDAAASIDPAATASTVTAPHAVPREPEYPAETPPMSTVDTTPVDTQVTAVKLSDKSDGKTLTGLMTDRFKPADGVFIAIDTQGTADRYTLSSKWLAPNGETLTAYSQVVNLAGPAETIFSLSKPDGWSKGQYQVELSINGKPMRTVHFTIQ